MTDKNFIQRIKFNTNYFPFEKDSEIIFWGENEMQKLIEFYLKTVKKIKEWDKLHNLKENADRFKINCILWNNWWWKSRLIDRLLKYKKYANWTDSGVLDLTEIKDDNVTINNWNFNISENKIILDDFFVLSPNISRSVNNYLMNIQWHNYSLCNIFNFLMRNDTINKIYSEFLNENVNLNWKLDITLEINFTTSPRKNISWEIINKYSERFKWQDIWNTDFDNFISIMISSRWFFVSYNNWNISDFKNISNLLRSEDNFFYILLTTSWILKELMDIYMNNINENSTFYNFIEFFKESGVLEWVWNKKNILLNKITDLYKSIPNDKHLYDKNRIKLIDILEEVYSKVQDWYSKKIINDWSFNEFTKIEIEFLSEHFDIDLVFKNKTFNNLSSWQKLILTRFTNIYMEIVNTNNYNIKAFTILIDEPDLHLHLDWQKKYIQKLIDVFSTLNTNINLHFIIATHSPFIISDLPSECIILLDKQNWSEYTKITDYDLNSQSFDVKNNKKTFWANFINIINDGFFFNDKVLMWSFSEINIKWFAIAQRFLMIWLEKIKDTNLDDNEKRIYEFLKESWISNIKDLELYIDNIWDTFLKDNLIYL